MTEGVVKRSMKKNREQVIIEQIQRQLRKVDNELKGYRVFLFGSRTEGNARERSDFDIGIFGRKPIPLKTFYKIEDLFDSIETLYKIDLVDFNLTSPSFRKEAMKTVRLLYES